MIDFLLGYDQIPLPIWLFGAVGILVIMLTGALLVIDHRHAKPRSADWRVSLIAAAGWSSYGFVVAWTHGWASVVALIVAVVNAFEAGRGRARPQTVAATRAMMSTASAMASLTAVGKGDRKSILLDHGWTYTTLLGTEHWYRPGAHPQTAVDLMCGTSGMNLDSAWATFRHEEVSDGTARH